MRFDRLRLTLGLWLRMLVATLVAVVGMTTLVVVEVGLAALMAAAFIESIPGIVIPFFAVGVVATVGFGLWISIAAVYRRLLPVSLVVGRIDHDGVADVLEWFARGLTRPPVPLTRREATLAVGIPSIALAGYLAIDHLPHLTPFLLGFVVGVGLVCYGTGRLVYNEWTADGAVRETVTEATRVPREADPDDDLEAERAALQRRVDRLAAQATIPSPTVALGRSSAPVAASVGYRPSTSTIVVSRGLVERLSERELEAVLAHELAHVINRDAAVLTALSLPATKFKAMMVGEDQEDEPAEDESTEATGESPVVGPHQGFMIVPMVPVFLVTTLAIASLARYREYVADQAAIAITGDPAALASALETLDADLERRPATDLRSHRSTAAFSIVPPPWDEHRFFDRTRRFVARRVFGTHPRTEKRIERLKTRTGDLER
ncbi:M48 family metallopeptidase [Natrarchaeobaculum sulfurireducens]|uniref:Putative protease htpX n=1 Tax=Natrarchaeobaculum sulfurireducens TaxID=2044521 RepID=A0A346PUA8_9EURY|nr:M48 family metalloprotease [Natrarchaeobaculum sulfurireducens]AXR83103.1 putative protease htpX [Natrarchaeobaculum sulfurireducens]